MPVYNQEQTIVQAVHELLEVPYPCEVELVIVDDSSTDRTPLLLMEINEPRVIFGRHTVKLGTSAALISAASLATGTHILSFYADLAYTPEDIPKLLEPVLKGRCTVVYGTRLSGHNTVHESYLYNSKSRILTFITNILFDAHISDLHTSVKLMPLATLKGLHPKATGFGADAELTALLLQRGIRPFEVPVTYYGRSQAYSQSVTWRRAFVCAWIILRIRLTAGERVAQGAHYLTTQVPSRTQMT